MRPSAARWKGWAWPRAAEARWAAPLLLAAALLGGCGTAVVNPVSGQSELTVMDEATEVAVGARGHQQTLQETPAYDNPALQAYVNRLGQQLAAQSQRANLKWTFTVLDSPEINAFALPGGYIYVTRGILAYLDSEAELAGVIGHEIGHVAARHGAQQATRQRRAGVGVLAATLLGAALETVGVGGATQAASRLSMTAAAGYVASYSRDQESQADQLGAQYLVRSRFDPRNMVDVIAVLKNQERFAADAARAEGRPAPAGAGWLASHPSNDQRLADITRIAAGYQGRAPGGYVDEGRARFLQAVDGITFGDSRDQGVVRGRLFVHEPLGIALNAPAGWHIENGSEAIAAVNPAGDAGLIVRLLPAQSGGSYDEVVRKLLQAGEGRSEKISLNGLAATQFDGVLRNAQGQTQPAHITIVNGPQQQVFLLQRAARDDASLQRAQAGLREAQASMRAATAADRAAARPWRVKMQPYPRGGFAELARRSPLPTLAEAQLRLLNGVYGGGGAGSAADPQPGQLVKVIVD